MQIRVDTQIVCQDEDQPPPATIEQWVKAALIHCASATLPAAELTVRLVDATEIQQLNQQYRGKDKPTNVLSFPTDLPDHIDLPLLGDVIVCAAVVNREAIEQHKPLEHHWAHMIIHGCLHLLGYDHIDPNEAEQMEALEIAILGSLQIDNPYIEREPVGHAVTNHIANL